MKPLLTLTLGLVLTSLSSSLVAAELQSSEETGNVGVVAGEDFAGGGAMAGSRRSLAPYLQSKADYDKAETAPFYVYRMISCRKTRRHRPSACVPTGGLQGPYIVKVQYPNVFLYKGGSRISTLGAFSQGVYKNKQTSGAFTTLRVTLDGVTFGKRELWYNNKYQARHFKNSLVKHNGTSTKLTSSLSGITVTGQAYGNGTTYYMNYHSNAYWVK